jgi:hypothetical protein
VDDPLVVRQVEEAVVDKFEDSVLRKKVISDPSAWGFKVGRHEALRIGKRRESRHRRDRAALRAHAVRLNSSQTPYPEVRAALAHRRESLTSRQWEAVEAVLMHGSISAAARALGKDRRGVSRLYRRARERLQLHDE